MRHIKLLLIISTSLFISSCNSENQKSADNEISDIRAKTKSKDSQSTEKVDLQIKDSTNLTHDKTRQDKDSTRVNGKAEDNLKVTINGKTFYKKHKNDIKVVGGESDTHYYNKEKDYYYDIATGRSVYIYGKHGVRTIEK